VKLLGRDLHRLPADELRRARCDFQMVFQDPYGSLDPRQTVARIVAEPLTAFGRVDRAEQRARVATVLKQVGLRDADMDKYPHEFSGGQRQRIAIARALITQPKLIVADEPVSALDVSVQAQVLNLLEDLQDEFGSSSRDGRRICSIAARILIRVRCWKPYRASVQAGSGNAAACR
jgi:peptide/nickel transport system ATP-binding protein